MTEFTTWRSLVDGAEISDIPDSEVYRWPADEGNGQTLNAEVGDIDISLNFERWASDANYVGGVAPNYDGTSDRGVSDTNISELNPRNSFSFEMWIDIDPNDVSTSDCLAFHAVDGDEQWGIGINQDTGDDISFAIRDPNDDNPSNVGASFAAGLHQLVLTWDATTGTQTAYFNTSEVTDSGNMDETGSPENDELFLAQRSDGLHNSDVIIDICRGFDEELSQSQVEDLFNLHPST